MKARVQIGDERHEVELMRDGSRISASIDGRKYEVEASEPEASVFLLKHNGSIYNALVSARGTLSSEYTIGIGNTEFHATVIDPKKLRGSATAAESESGRAEIKASMPGKVVRILVSVGDPVKKGDGIIVVEAMKMQNEMRSPKDGVVTEIKVAQSDTVSAGDVLLVID